MFDLTDAQRDLQARARELAQGHVAARAADVDQTEEYPWDTVEQLTKHGFMGMTIPTDHGGVGLSYMDTVLVVEEMAKACGVTARIVVEGNMGAIGTVMAYGTAEQKSIAAKLVLAGDKPAICITEPEAGSAATEMTTTAVRDGNGYVLNGTKHWITGGGVSRMHMIFARLIEDGVDQGIAGFLAFRDEDKGLVIGDREPAMGLKGIPETQVHFEDLKLDADRIIIPPDGIKRGFAGLMNAYNAQRVGAATVALGIAQGAFEAAQKYAKEREQFGRPIAEFQGLQWMFADMSVALNAARLMVWRAASSAEHTEAGFPDPLMAAEAKVIASETAIRVTNDALQIHGAMGYSRRLPLERMARDARMFTIGGGTAQMLKNLIAGKVLGIKTPQTRDGYSRLAGKESNQ
ncbi:MAG: acyl-CoA dehydrogenase [Rhodospirillales bacterium]|jgi:3-sulfinopropanoyl-CoA desulfinase|nr:acyl-CoA dehydrogenase [Rhodospirillales bacterium]MBT4041570.1 acyl-CoA dehydrogenase [Rhodospirillales bacterium]MBT4627669.1 acyl-CoA dehydrogenase [Rhodospirillales bacterium]MBT5352906.1 acyl-CoA dehydrogenase [Rhodospirillales bacterium]MBT5519251.1 acyl-CoA dehydrogenase [Rhodospirillales bacterium]